MIAAAKATRIDDQIGQPYLLDKIAMMTPAKAIIEPSDRSNSPPIISSATATARMPSWAETSRKLTVPRALNRPLSPAKTAKKNSTSTQPAAAPSSGRRRAWRAKPISRTRSSRLFACCCSVTAISGDPSSGAA
jgi:hypothetical protein